MQLPRLWCFKLFKRHRAAAPQKDLDDSLPGSPVQTEKMSDAPVDPAAGPAATPAEVPVAATVEDPKAYYLNLSHPVDFTTTTDTSTIKGKSILITGGAMGIGEAFVRHFASNGAYVTIADWSEEEGLKLEKELKEANQLVQFVKTDVSDWDSILECFKKAILWTPQKGVDVVIANAGIAANERIMLLQAPPPTSVDDLPEKLDTKVVSVNYVGVLYTVKLALHYFRLPSENPVPGRKQLILIGSMGGYTEMQGATMYNSSKFAVRGIFKSLRNAVPKETMRLNLIAPNFVRTRLTERAVPFLKQLGWEFAKMEDVVAAASRLVSDDEINGRAISILPTGPVDLGDDVHGRDAGDQMHKWFLANKWV